MPRAGARARRSETERALWNFSRGFNCAQSVVSAFSQELGLDRKMGHRVSQSFGGGMARLGLACGAVTGGLIVIGLKYGKTEAKDNASRDKAYAVSREFVRRFEARHGSLNCRTLLGHNIGTPRGWKLIQKKNLHHTRCERYVRDAVRILEKLLQE